MPSKEYYEKNKEEIKEQVKKYKQSEKGKEAQQKAEQKYKQSEKGKEAKQKYKQSEKGKETRRIFVWKQLGVKCDDWNELYEYYINCWECENCGVELVEGHTANNRRCLDHCHKTGKFRNVLCSYCNLLRGE